jgi:hypothetical protein
LLYIWLSQSLDPYYEVSWLAWLTRFFSVFFIFFQLSTLSWLLFIRLFWSHNLGYEFCRLTRVDLDHFIVSFFKLNFFSNFIIQQWYWEVGFIICFDFFFYWVILVSWPGSWVLWVNPSWLCFFFFYFLLGYFNLMTWVMGLTD